MFMTVALRKGRCRYGAVLITQQLRPLLTFHRWLLAADQSRNGAVSVK